VIGWPVGEKGETMKRLLFLIVPALLIGAVANADETKIMYYQSKIPGPQITKDYYVKESINKPRVGVGPS